MIEKNEGRIAEGKEPRSVPLTALGSPLRSFRFSGTLDRPGIRCTSRQKDRKLPAGKNRCKALRDNIVRDEHNKPVMRQWTALIEPDEWWTVHPQPRTCVFTWNGERYSDRI